MNVPQVRMSNTFFEEGDFSRDEIFDVKSAIYLKGGKAGQVSPKTGTFTFASQYGFAIENGEIAGMIKNASISGNILKDLNFVDAVGKDLEFHPGTCGKGGQGVPVTTGGPHIRISRLAVG